MINLQEDPLRPFEIVRVRGVHLPVPIVAESQRLELAAELRHIAFRGGAGVLAGLDGVLLSGEAEGIPAHGVQDVVAELFLVAAEDVRGGVAFGMADVQALSAGVGEHIQRVVLGLRGIESRLARPQGAEGLLRLPDGLPLGFKLMKGKRITAVRTHGGSEMI